MGQATPRTDGAWSADAPRLLSIGRYSFSATICIAHGPNMVYVPWADTRDGDVLCVKHDQTLACRLYAPVREFPANGWEGERLALAFFLQPTSFPTDVVDLILGYGDKASDSGQAHFGVTVCVDDRLLLQGNTRHPVLLHGYFFARQRLQLLTDFNPCGLYCFPSRQERRLVQQLSEHRGLLRQLFPRCSGETPSCLAALDIGDHRVWNFYWADLHRTFPGCVPVSRQTSRRRSGGGEVLEDLRGCPSTRRVGDEQVLQ